MTQRPGRHLWSVTWYGSVAHAFPPQQKRGRRGGREGGKENWGHAKLQEPGYRDCCNTGTLRDQALAGALLGARCDEASPASGVTLSEGQTTARASPGQQSLAEEFTEQREPRQEPDTKG